MEEGRLTSFFEVSPSAVPLKPVNYPVGKPLEVSMYLFIVQFVFFLLKCLLNFLNTQPILESIVDERKDISIDELLESLPLGSDAEVFLNVVCAFA